MATDPKGRQTLTLNDFSPGCFDASNTLTYQTTPAPVGSADPNYTWCCSALDGGGLGPLPAIVNSYAGVGNPASQLVWIVGMAVNPELASGNTEVVYLMEWDNGTNHSFLGESFVVETSTANTMVSVSGTTASGIFGAPYPTWTRMANTSATTTPGNPVLVFPAYSATATNNLLVYPTPAAPTTFATFNLCSVSGAGITGQVVCYDGRVLVLAGINYSYPAGGGTNTNENINYTDPPNSTSYGDQQTVLVPEDPFGYGAWGSISAGELFLVKKWGGAVMVTGDIDNPGSVTHYPGVIPTGNFVGHAASTEAGLFYCSESRGAWVWNGGNVSQKVSSQLQDNFYDCTTNVVGTGGGMPSNNYGFFCTWAWSDYVAFSNNWIYNMRSQSWWTLYPRNGQTASGYSQPTTFFHYEHGNHGYLFYAMPLAIPSSATPINVLYQFDARTPAPHWQWQSTPIPLVPDADHVADVREIMVRCSSTDSASTLTLTVLNNAGTAAWGPVSSTAGEINNGASFLRFNVAALGVTDLVLRINGDLGTTAPPIIDTVTVRYNIRAHTPTVD